MIHVHIRKYNSSTYIPPVGHLEFVIDGRNTLGEDFGEVVMFSPEINAPIKYRSNRSEQQHLNQVLLKITMYGILILETTFL